MDLMGSFLGGEGEAKQGWGILCLSHVPPHSKKGKHTVEFSASCDKLTAVSLPAVMDTPILIVGCITACGRSSWCFVNE